MPTTVPSGPQQGAHVTTQYEEPTSFAPALESNPVVDYLVVTKGSTLGNTASTNKNILDDGNGVATITELHAKNGTNGSFMSQDGKVVTIVDGIITSIV